MRKRLILAAAAWILCPSTWAAPALAQACYGDSYPSYSYGGGACYSGSYVAVTGPAYSTTGSYTYAAPTVGSRVVYRAFHPFAGLRGRIAARRALRGTWVAGGACYSEGYGGGGYSAAYAGSGCYSGGYGAGYAPYYAAPAHYHTAPMAYATPAYQPVPRAAPVAPANCPNGFCLAQRPNVAPAPMPSPQVAPVQPGAGTGTHPCPCGDAACNHTLGACPCTDPACKCHLPGPSVVPAPAPVAPHHPGKAVKP
jgi:hypothetical protein